MNPEVTFGTATLQGRNWVIQAEPHVTIRLKRIFKKGDRGVGKITITNTPENARDLEWVLERYPLEVRTEHLDELRAAATLHRELSRKVSFYLSGAHEPKAFKLALPPRSYQAREAEVVLEQGFLLVADEVGLGKTCAAICVMTDPRALPAVVVTLTHLPRQWEYEIGKFAPGLNVHVIKKAKPYPLPTFIGQLPDVVVINYHKLTNWAPILKSFARLVVFDEIQELRSMATLRYHAAWAIAEGAPFRIGLSATPVHNYGDEVFSLLEILKPGLLGSHQEFVSEWCRTHGNGKYSLTEPRAFGTWARENGVIVRHTRVEVGRELPDVVKVIQDVDCDQKRLAEVEDMAADLARLILSQGESHRGEKWHASEELQNLLRQATGVSKAPYVADFVRLLVESGEKVVLCGWHREVYSIWESRLHGIKVAYYTGTESPNQKEASKAAFVSGDVQVLFLSLRSGAGLNDLQNAASVIVFGELDWSPAVHEQAIGRLHRDGQDRSVLAYFLVAKGGSDPVIAEVLGLKKEQLEGIRDPHHALTEKLDTTGPDRIKRLAEAYLKKVGPTERARKHDVDELDTDAAPEEAE